MMHLKSKNNLRSSRNVAGTARSAADMSGKLGVTASGDITGSGNKPVNVY
jgi:hypothetical protein